MLPVSLDVIDNLNAAQERFDRAKRALEEAEARQPREHFVNQMLVVDAQRALDAALDELRRARYAADAPSRQVERTVVTFEKSAAALQLLAENAGDAAEALHDQADAQTQIAATLWGIEHGARRAGILKR